MFERCAASPPTYGDVAGFAPETHAALGTATSRTAPCRIRHKQALDPIETLTFAAGRISRIALGTSILDLPFNNPVVLARRLTTLDVLSGGWLSVGFGQGWSEDEFQAVGVSAKERGARADEFLTLRPRR